MRGEPERCCSCCGGDGGWAAGVAGVAGDQAAGGGGAVGHGSRRGGDPVVVVRRQVSAASVAWVAGRGDGVCVTWRLAGLGGWRGGSRLGQAGWRCGRGGPCQAGAGLG